MITSFGFKNYKAFKEGEIELKPITILLGENSVGKSSILQLISMIKQTTNIEKEYKSALKLNGEFVSLGENINIFHNKVENQDLEISFSLVRSDFLELISDMENHIIELYIILNQAYELLTNADNNNINFNPYNRSSKKGEVKSEEIYKLIQEIQSLKIKINNKAKGNNKSLEEWFFRYSRYRRSFYNIYSTKTNKVILNSNTYKDAYTLLNEINKSINTNEFINLSYSIILKNNDLIINKVELKQTNRVILGYQATPKKKLNMLYSEIIGDKLLIKYSKIFKDSIDFNKLDINSKQQENEDLDYPKPYRKLDKVECNVFIEIVFKIFKNFTRQIKENFQQERINYVSPLRAFPKRYYFLDEANITTSLNTIDGNQLTEVLKENKSVKKNVNDRLKKFNLTVDIEKLADVIHNIKINQHGLDLDITDVGFGLSQVLPVIVQGFLSRPNSLTIVEQPEIHLHPKMQSQLADLFIDIVKSNNSKTLLIETHSEYLLKRLRRKIAEGELLAEEVNIYFIHPKGEKGGSAKIEKIAISETGDFEWPSDFFDTNFDDTIAFLKLQK